MSAEILYTYTTPVFFSKNGDTEATYEYYWDPLLEEGGLRNAKTKRNTPIIRRVGGDSQMYVSTRDEVLEIISINKRANYIPD